ncbi:MAG TPA: peptidoglycan-binding protein, partial [Caldilineaceae bacterium]|nr:peptidoglycan-binding protein [Caldilineaceae bacterium]
GWVLGARIQSPAEAAARTAPPTPSPILVPVERRMLTSDIVARGTARFGLPQSLSLVPSTLKSRIGIITTLPARGTQLQEGDLLLTASERPVFVLQGEIPVYRDLTPGVSGTDVRQFETSLQRLGFDPGPVDGTFDEQTSAAVVAWYTAAGWQPIPPTSEQLAQLRALEDELATALDEKAAAEEAAAAAPLTLAAVRADTEKANKLAAAEVAAKRVVLDQTLADANASEAERSAAHAEVEVAEAAAKATQLEGEVANQAASDAQKAAERAVVMAAASVDRIGADLAEAKRKVGVQMPADELVFIPVLPVRIEQAAVAVGDPPSGSVLTVTNNQLAIDSSLPLDEAPLVKPGMAVAIDEPDLGIEATGVVARVASAPGTDGVDGFHIYFETLVDETPSDLAGFSLRLTIPVQSTGGAVIAVPVSALALTVDGSSTVQVEKNGALATIRVEPGLSADGFVEVTPIDSELEPGQLVVIGYEKQE